MTGPTRIDWRARLWFIGSAALLAAIALTGAPPAAQARVWVGVGGPCCGYWGPGPYYGYPPPSYDAPPPDYSGYYPQAPGYYPPPPDYDPQTQGPSAYAPAAPGMPPAPEMPTASAATAMPLRAAAPANPATAGVAYTSKPAFTNSAGQTCREYKTSAGGRDVFGTACQQADGQWRVVN
ncbi:MAG TPA: hypothetical protein VG308_20275 [Stellaceae bacterium]|jgi:hypothetical protein|nr:hypothetical protein [Stellaceae bacterium]